MSDESAESVKDHKLKKNSKKNESSMRVNCDFTSIAKLHCKKEKELVDVKVYISKMADVSISKANNGSIKRIIEVVDETKMMTRIVFWNDAAVAFKANKYDLLCVKSGKVGAYQGKKYQ